MTDVGDLASKLRTLYCKTTGVFDVAYDTDALEALVRAQACAVPEADTSGLVAIARNNRLARAEQVECLECHRWDGKHNSRCPNRTENP